MATFQSGFVRPKSVTKQVTNSTAVASTSLYPTVFVGAGRRRKLYMRDSKNYGALITREDTSGLTNEDVFYESEVLSSCVVSTITNVNTGETYTKGTHFTVENVSGGGASMIKWIGTTKPTSGNKYVVNFYIPKDPLTDYSPIHFTKMSTMQDWCGEKFYAGEDLTGEVGYPQEVVSVDVNGSVLINGVTWAAEMANNNGGGAWYVLELNPYDETTFADIDGPKLIAGATSIDDAFATEARLKIAYQQALTKLLKLNAWCLIPTFPITNTVSAGAQYTAVNTSLLPITKQHIEQARSTTYQKFRVALLGAPIDSEKGVLDPTILFTDAATALSNKAICYLAPSTASYGYNSDFVDVDGSMIAAAVSGILTNPTYDAGETVFGKEIVGFEDIKDPFDEPQKTILGGAGVMFIDKEVLAVPAIVFDSTTAPTLDVESEIKYTRVADYLSEAFNKVLHKKAIAQRNFGGSAESTAKALLTSILEGAKTLHMIDSFDVTVEKNASDSRQLDIHINVALTTDVVWAYNVLGLALA